MVELLSPLVTAERPGQSVALAVRLPTGARARDVHGDTAQLARPIELTGRVDFREDMQDTISPVAMQRALQASQSGLDLLTVRLDDPGPLLAAVGASGM